MTRPLPVQARLGALLIAVVIAVSASALALTAPAAAAGRTIDRQAASWPSWRGGVAQGRVDGPLPTHWTAGEGIRWKTPIPGRGHSSPIVYGDRLYVTTADVDRAGQRLDGRLRAATLGLLVVVAALTVQLVVARCHPERQPTTSDLARAGACGFAILALAVIATGGDALVDFPRCNIRSWLTGVGFVSLCVSIAAAAAGSVASRRAFGLAAVLFGGFALLEFPSRDFAFRGGVGSVRMQIALAACAIPLALGAAIALERPRGGILRMARRWISAAVAIVVVGLAIGLLLHIAVFRDGHFPEKPYAPRLGVWWLGLPATAAALAWLRHRRAGSLWLNVTIAGLAALSIAVLAVFAVERLAMHSVYLSYQLDEPRFALSVSRPVAGAAAAAFAIAVAWVLARAGTRAAAPIRPGPLGLGLTTLALAALFFVRANYVSAEPQMTRAIVALDRASGRVAWTLTGLEGPQAAFDGRNTPATPTAVTDGRRICAYFGSPGLMCADTNGRLIWSRRDISYEGFYGVGFSPVLADGLLVVASETPEGQADVHAINAADGATRWRRRFTTRPTATGNNRTPIVREVAGRQILVLWGLNDVRGLALDSGEPAWLHATASGGDLVSSAVSDGDRLFLSDVMGTRALDYDQLAAGREAVRWTSQARANCASPVIVNGILFTVTDGGIATALDTATGVALWRKRLPGHYYASLIASSAAVYFTNSDGLTSVVAAERAFRLIATSDIDDETMASMAAADGELYMRSTSAIYAIGAGEVAAN